MMTSKLTPIFFIVALMAMMALLTSCDRYDCTEGHGSILSTDLYADDFESLSIKGSLEVFVSQAPVQRIEAVGHSNVIERLRLDKRGNDLQISLASGCYEDYELALYIETPYIESLSLDGSGRIDIADMTMGQELALNLDGSGRIRTHALDSLYQLDITVSGSGEIAFVEPMAVNTMTVGLSGSGDIHAFDVASQSVEAEVRGSGTARVFATTSLDASISGRGEIQYIGFPTIDLNVTGSGRLTDRN